jgi:ribosomal protein S18 acetylase RimI-like enzyme
MTIRRATMADAAAVGELTERVYRDGGFTDDDYAEELRDAAVRIEHATVLVASIGDRIVGALAVATPGSPLHELAGPDEAEVRMLAVAEDQRGRGIAGRLMAAAEALAVERGARAVVLSTEPEMHAAHRLYERRGYERVPDRDWVTGPFELLAYRRVLDPAS